MDNISTFIPLHSYTINGHFRSTNNTFNKNPLTKWYTVVCIIKCILSLYMNNILTMMCIVKLCHFQRKFSIHTHIWYGCEKRYIGSIRILPNRMIWLLSGAFHRRFMNTFAFTINTKKNENIYLLCTSKGFIFWGIKDGCYIFLLVFFSDFM